MSMTREYAISYLEWIRPKKPYTQDKKNVQKSIDMAIEALKERHGKLEYNEGDKMVDCLKCIHCRLCDYQGIPSNPPQCDFYEERQNGEWIDVNGDGSIMKCSVCGDKVCCKNNNFCPNCGADMREGKKE